MTNKVEKHRVDYYSPNDEFIRYDLFDSEEQALKFTDSIKNVRTSVVLKYVGIMELNMVCTECSKSIDPNERHINQNNELFYCMDCIDEINVIEYVTKNGEFLGTDNEIEVENDTYV